MFIKLIFHHNLFAAQISYVLVAYRTVWQFISYEDHMKKNTLDILKCYQHWTDHLNNQQVKKFISVSAPE